MSGIAQKSYPGSWPQSKRGETAESPSVEHEATPRTKPPLPEDIDTSGAKGDSCGQGAGSHSEGFSQNGEYTHKQQQPDGGEAEEDGDEQIKMNDVEAKEEKVTEHGTEAETAPEEMGKDIPEAQQKQSEEKPEVEEQKLSKEKPDLQEQKPEQLETEAQEQKPEELDTEVQEKKPEQFQTEQLETEVPDEKPEQTEQSEIETKAGGEETEQPAKTASTTKTSLTEMAKRAFDQASQNQPTDEARDAYLEASRAGQSQPPETEAPAAPEVEGQETPEALQKQPTEAEDDQQKLQLEPEKDQTEQQQKLQEETDKDHPEAEGETAAPEEPETEPVDFSILKNGTVNKGGNVVNGDGKAVGRVTEGILKHLIGKKVDEKGNIWSTDGKIVGKAEPVLESERDELLKEPAPFESFPDAVVDKDGFVVSNGEQVGKVIQGDLAILRGKSVDPDGDILDKAGNVVGKAVRWEPEPEPEPEPEVPVDKSILAGKRVNKAGNVVDGSGVIFGRVVEGDVKRMVGRMCDKNGNILSESGDILGKAELVPEGEREGLKEGPFAELEGCTVAKDGTVVTPAGDIVGRVIKGDAKILFGRAVDEDGDILDKNGNVLGQAERWEPEAVERKKNPMSGRKVNREGNVVDEDGNIIGKLTSGDLQKCSGKEIDDDGDVVDYKGNVVGHCSLIEDIPKVEEESPEDKEKREQAEQDKKLAIQMSVCIEQCLDKIRPICKMITEKIDKAERTPEDERDEEALVREVKPLIEEGGRILSEAKGIIKGLDPDGRIAANAKHKSAAREATPEEHHLADVLKDLTGDVTQCIDNAKRKLEDMPHAKKELNPLWGLLNEPLFQILAAVGLLLAGVLNLVGRLLAGLGLGGLVDGLLGTLGISRVLEGLGLGSFTKSLKGGKKKGGGLLGGVLGG